MRQRTLKSLLVLSGIILLAGSVHAADAEKPAAEKKPASAISLDGPHMYEANRHSSNLVTGDFNGDGRMDFAAVANEESILRLFLQNDEKEEEKFRHEDITLDRIVTVMAPLDMNGDGRVDLVMAGAPPSLSILFQTEAGTLQKGKATDLRATTLSVADLDGDKRNDLLLFDGKKTEVLRNTGRGIDMEPAQRFYSTTDISGVPSILDVDADGKSDIAYAPAERNDTIAIRPQSPDGEFPAEFFLKTGVMRAWDVQPIADERGLFAAVHASTRDLVMLQMAEPLEEKDAKGTLTVSDPRFVAFNPDTWDDKAFSTVADVDGDGRLDLLMALPKSASVRLVRQTRAGGFEPLEVPSLEDLKQIMPWPVKEGEPAPLLLLSGKEKTIGVARFEGKEDGTLKFPNPIPLPGKPVAMAAAEVTGDKEMDLVVASSGKEGRELLVVSGYKPFDKNMPQSKQLVKLEGGKDDPNGLTAVDLNQDGLDDLVVFYEFDPPITVIQKTPGQFVQAPAAGMLASLIQGGDPRRLTSLKLDGREKPELLAVKEGYAREFHLDKDGNVQIAGQYNGKNKTSRLRAAAAGHLRDNKHLDLALLDVVGQTLSVYGVHDEAAGYGVLRHIDLDSPNYQSVESFDLDGDGRDDLLLVGPDRVTIYFTRVLNGSLESLDSHETEVEEGGYGQVQGVPIGDGGKLLMAAVEMKDNLIEFFELDLPRKGDPEIKPVYHFRMYDSDASIARRSNLDAPPEPRELAAADLNGDGKPDLLALVHDYVIVYYRK